MAFSSLAAPEDPGRVGAQDSWRKGSEAAEKPGNQRVEADKEDSDTEDESIWSEPWNRSEL